ncbi:MAG: hypothetical protein O3B65_02885 [Chloroflexi bacterium]|nr:hypothetical protein [Chloroflexota bacterium]
MRRIAPSPALAEQRGTTALETAIILIAFIVVASVFAYVVLSAGIFTSQKSGETVSAGIHQVTSTIALSGDPKADAVMATVLSTVDNPGRWNALPNVTRSTVSGDRKEGTFAVALAIAPAFGSGLVAYENLGSTADLSGHLAAGLWIKSSSAVADNVFELIIDDSPNCGSPEESLGIAGLAADTWAQPRMKLSGPSALTAVACVGVRSPSDPGAITLTIDLVQGPPEVHTVYVNVNNTIPTKGVGFVAQIDTNNDGLLSDEANQQNDLIITFSNEDMLVRDLAWTVTELGAGDGDTDLEYGETFMLTIDLRAVDPIPTAKTLMRLALAASENSVLLIEKRIPRNISTSLILR